MRPISTAAAGLVAAERRLGEAAEKLTRAADDPSVDVATEMVKLREAKTLHAASAKVVRAVSDTIGRVVDLLA
jgi:hypothetical protein